jgi:hypothetical protein
MFSFATLQDIMNCLSNLQKSPSTSWCQHSLGNPDVARVYVIEALRVNGTERVTEFTL